MAVAPRPVLAHRMTVAVLLLSLVLSALSAAVLYVVHFRELEADVERILETVRESNVPALGASLWVMDVPHLEMQVRALASVPYIGQVRIEAGDRVVASAGTPVAGWAIHRAFPLTYVFDGRTRAVGVLHVEVDRAAAGRALSGRMGWQLAVQLLQIGLVAIFMLYLFRKLVTSRLAAIDGYLMRIASDVPDGPLVLPGHRFFRGEDELDHVAGTIAAMRAGLDKAFRDLAESEEKYRTVAEFTLDWEYWVAPDGSFRYCSPSCRDVTGREAAEFHADPETLRRIIHPDDVAGFLAHRDEVLAMRSPMPLLFRIVHADGSVRWVEHVSRMVLSGAGEPLGIRASNRDVTERRSQQDLLHRKNVELEATLARTKRLEGLISICMHCKRIHQPDESWGLLESYISEHADVQFSHGLCPRCAAEHYPGKDLFREQLD